MNLVQFYLGSFSPAPTKPKEPARDLHEREKILAAIPSKVGVTARVIGEVLGLDTPHRMKKLRERLRRMELDGLVHCHGKTLKGSQSYKRELLWKKVEA